MEKDWDTLILGAGGAGLFCAARAARRGRSVLVLEHQSEVARKVLISGGGRCNFTNTGASPENYFSENPHFARSALSRFRPEEFLRMIRRHEVPFYEKKLGQLFCRDSSRRIVDLLERECREAGARIQLGTRIQTVASLGGNDASAMRYRVDAAGVVFQARSLVVATGGLSIPKIGASDLGYRIARQFGLRVTELSPALVSLTMGESFLSRYRGISGVSVDCEIRIGRQRFRENLLFTHSGISGPAVLQASLHWHPGEMLLVDLLPGRDAEQELLELKQAACRKELRTVLGSWVGERFAERWLDEQGLAAAVLAEKPDRELRRVAQALHAWELTPLGTGGYGRAEVTRGGVSTDELSSKTMEARKQPGLFFIGELVDVTGWLGGYNLHWAWASAAAAGDAC